MRNIRIVFTFVIVLLNSFIIYASNELSVLTDDFGSTKPGFIQNCTIVIEPHGGYFEQSLYIEYTDNNQFQGSSNVEIVHRFELPEGSVINDMWLWIGDSVMQAIMMDTWTATNIYDSIVVNKRDPALLKKKGNQYELHVYPLRSGEYRKVKINMITPVKWLGDLATCELPFKMLNANNAEKKPVEILFRSKDKNWVDPIIFELPSEEFHDLKDTLDYSFKLLSLDDISTLSSLKVQFKSQFAKGNFISGNNENAEKSFFQLGVVPGDFFEIEKDTSANKVLFAVDLSGDKCNNIDTFIPKFNGLLESALKNGDEYNIIIAGANRIESITNGWQNFSITDDQLNIFLNDFLASEFADSIKYISKKNILFCDYDANRQWSYSKIGDFANLVTSGNIVASLEKFSNIDIAAAYRHGFDDLISKTNYDQIKPVLDAFFESGGRFVTYFDHNRNYKELIAKGYIPGLYSTHPPSASQTLYRNVEGNIGIYFPEEIDLNFAGALTYDDPDVKVELMNSKGEPAIISKKIGNGLLVVSSIWELKIDGALKTILNPPQLGLNEYSKNLLLPNLMDSIVSISNAIGVQKVNLISNSDTLYTDATTGEFVVNYLSHFNLIPVINTINLLDGSRGSNSILIDDQTYYGSGYLLSELSKSSNGLHFETYKDDWDIISASLKSNSLPPLNDFKLDITADGGNGDIVKLYEVNSNRNDPNRPIFYIGETNGIENLNVDFTASFQGIDSIFHKNIGYNFINDTLSAKNILPSLIANEDLKLMFNAQPIDTAGIVQLAIDHNLLTDYTALLALEPNDSIHFLIDPFDESDLTDVIENTESIKDSLFMEIYPNPFNNQVQINLVVKDPSIANITIYNILGQKIIEIAKNAIIEEKFRYTWFGKNSFGSNISSGIYIVRVELTGITTKKRDVLSKKLLYLK